MNKSELLAYAKKLYPRGTTYRRPGTSIPGRIEDELHIFSHTTGDQITDGCGGSVYLYGEWSQIISHPVGYIVPDHTVNNYPIY